MNKNWRHQTHRRAAVVFDQMRAALACAPDEQARTDFLRAQGNPYFDLLDDLYGEDYQLARLLDLSDLVVHAEGPDLRDPMPALAATAWLCGAADKQLRQLILATMDLAREAKRKVSKEINLRLTGLAPGSLYAGFTLMPGRSDLLDADQELAYIDARAVMQGLSHIPEYIDDERLLPGINEAMPDAAVRDASLAAAYSLAPTGRRGIHTIGLSVPGQPSAKLGQPERVVLWDALQKPALSNRHTGRFVGEVRAADLDRTRFHLKTEHGVIRCVTTKLEPDQAREIFGRTVEVSGLYEADKDSRPRLLLVESIRVIAIPAQHSMTFSAT